jgi:hypothetical protein
VDTRNFYNRISQGSVGVEKNIDHDGGLVWSIGLMLPVYWGIIWCCYWVHSLCFAIIMIMYNKREYECGQNAHSAQWHLC